jgi:HAD superfamily hydrolase (TIGR01509 family)
VFLDAGGVIVLPDRDLVAGALRRIGIEIDRDAVPRAHYRTVRAFDRGDVPTANYLQALCSELGILPGRTVEASAALAELADRRRSGEILWSQPTPGALSTIAGLRRRGLPVVIVTNSDGHAEQNLRDCGLAGVPVIDSEVVGVAKPDVRIFEAALTRAGAGIRATDVVHVGDATV